METKATSCHQTLLNRIEELKELKLQQKATISKQFKDLTSSLNIGTILKESISHLASDSDTQKDLVKMAATTGTNYVIEKFLGSNNSIKRFIGSLLAEKVSNSFIGNFISKF